MSSGGGRRRIYPAHVQAIGTVLARVFGEGQRPDKALEAVFLTLRRPGSSDRALIAESAYDLIRHWRFWWYRAGQDPQTESTALRALVINYLELKLDLEKNGLTLAQWYAEQKSRVPPAVFFSIPDEAWALGEEALGAAWEQEVAAQDEPAPPHLRVNLLRTSLQEAKKALEAENITTITHPLSPHALVVAGPYKNVFRSEAFRRGWVEMQDAGSQAVSLFADPSPGQRVVDACAGAGGKTLHMAMLMRNKGRIIALDIYEHKLNELRRRCARAGADVVETRLVTSSRVIKRLRNSADLVLVDAPCTGSGTWRRNPDLKYRLTAAWLHQCTEVQAEVLRAYAPLVKPGGRLVYATCSILPAENQGQWQKFLQEFPEFSHLDSRSLLPSQHQCDGFFMASAQRIG